MCRCERTTQPVHHSRGKRRVNKKRKAFVREGFFKKKHKNRKKKAAQETNGSI